LALRLPGARRAENLLRSIRALDMAKVTEAQADSIVQQYGGEAEGITSDGSCTSAHETYAAFVKSNFSLWVGHKLPMLQFAGNRAWGVAASFQVDEEGLCRFDYSVVATVPHGSDLIEVNSAYWRLLGVFNYYVYDTAHAPQYSRGLRVTVDSAATTEQKRKALDFDLSCLTRFGGCKAGCELMPSAWLDYQREARKAGFTLPTADVKDTRCKLLGESR
jgi:hypothetical protein